MIYFPFPATASFLILCKIEDERRTAADILPSRYGGQMPFSNSHRLPGKLFETAFLFHLTACLNLISQNPGRFYAKPWLTWIKLDFWSTGGISLILNL
jgi:hypothetical protein